MSAAAPASQPDRPPQDALGPNALDKVRSALPQALRAGVQSARELARTVAEEEREPLATAHPALDLLLPGGLPRGELVELVGGRSSGRFSLVVSVLAAVTGTGEAAALVDLGDHLAPADAAARGADLARLLWLRPENLRQALAGAEMLLASGFPLVVVDLGQPPLCGGRGAEAAWLRLARAARAQGAALLVASPYRVSGTAAAAVLKAERSRSSWSGSGHASNAPRLLDRLAVRLVVEKRRGALPGQSAVYALSASTVPQPEPARERSGPLPVRVPDLVPEAGAAVWPHRPPLAAVS
jgi:protein ImuA